MKYDLVDDKIKKQIRSKIKLNLNINKEELDNTFALAFANKLKPFVDKNNSDDLK